MKNNKLSALLCLFIAISMLGTSFTACSSNSGRSRKNSRKRSKAEVELSNFGSGKKSKERAIDDFRNAVNEQLGIPS